MFSSGTSQQANATLYSDDVFSAYTYTGNGSTQTITNGIDLSGKGGLVWNKCRSTTWSNYLQDTVRGIGNELSSDSTSASGSNGYVSAVSSTGFSLGISNGENQNAATYVSWTFRKAPKFFDVVTYTGNATNNRTVSHSLGQTPGMIIVKRTDSAGSWWVWHRGFNSGNGYGELNATGQFGVAGALLWGDGSTYVAPTSSVFTISSAAEVNTNAGTYVAYLFAHDTATDGIIQCGSFVGNGSLSGPTVTLGWEPQFVLLKQAGVTGGNWMVMDSSRGLTMGSDAVLQPNTTSAELDQALINPTATGFVVTNAFSDLNQSGETQIYLAIRRPNKPPTTGTQVYNAIARTGTGAAATVTGVGFAPDLFIGVPRSVTIGDRLLMDRLRGRENLLINTTNQAANSVANYDYVSYNQDGFSVNLNQYGQVNYSGAPIINWCFKRAPGVFDEVCYTGTGSTTTVAHNLGVAPEMIIVKKRSAIANWPVRYSTAASPGYGMYLNDTGTEQNITSVWTTTAPTASVFSVGTSGDSNTSTATYVAYLFATKAGISKVGSYTGNGSSQTINAGFTTGARFILIKRTDATGDWYVWDSTRGIVAGNDPHLSLNTTATEVTTDDSVDTDTSGFIVNQDAATNINVTSATYIYLAFA